jgi:hypothetical protein
MDYRVKELVATQPEQEGSQKWVSTLQFYLEHKRNSRRDHDTETHRDENGKLIAFPTIVSRSQRPTVTHL